MMMNKQTNQKKNVVEMLMMVLVVVHPLFSSKEANRQKQRVRVIRAKARLHR
jgi:hypothetical protein